MIAGGRLSRVRRRCTVARDTPSAAQAAAVMPLFGASATTASVKARRRWAPMGCPAAPPLFLDPDDGLGPRQVLRQASIVPLQQRQFGGERIGFGDLRAAPDRRQRAEGPGVALPAPVGQRRGVDALATQNGADAAGRGSAIGLGENAQLVLRREGPSAWPIRQFRGCRDWCRRQRRPTASAAAGTSRDVDGWANHGHGRDDPSAPSRLNLRGGDVSSSLLGWTAPRHRVPELGL